MFKIHEIKYLLSPSHLELKKNKNKTKKNKTKKNNNNNNKITSTYSTNIKN